MNCNKYNTYYQFLQKYLLYKKMEKEEDQIKQVQTIIRNFQARITLIDQAIKLSLKNADTLECFEGLYTFDQFSDPVKNNFQSVSEIYEEIQNIVDEKKNSKIENAAERLLIDEKNNFIFKYGVLKKNKLEFKSQILMTKEAVKQPLKQGELSFQVQLLKKKNSKLQNTVQNILTRLQKLQKTLEIYQKKEKLLEKKEDEERIIQEKDEIQNKIGSNQLRLKLENSNSITCRIQSEEGEQFETNIQKSDISEEIKFIYPDITDLFKQFTHILNKDHKKVQGKKILIDKNFNIQFQVEIQRAGQKLVKKGIFRTKAIQLNRLENIQRIIKLNDKKQKQYAANIQQSLFKKINRISEDQLKLENQLANLGSKFTQKLNSIEKNLKSQVQEMTKASNQYFDVTHPNYDKFTVTNNRIIHKSTNNTFYHIMSPIRISSTFTTYTYKAITSLTYNMMYGLASKQLKNNQTGIYSSMDFIGYYGYGTGYVYDQKIRGSCVNKGGISAGDQIKIVVNLSGLKISWFKNGSQIYSSNIPQVLAQKQLYPALILYNNGDTVQMSF